MVDDAGNPISYMALERGTACYSSDDEMVGTVREVLSVPAKDVFDGLVISTGSGQRFIDGPEVAHIYERRVEIAMTAEEIAAAPERQRGTLEYEPRPARGRLGEFWQRITLRGPWRRD